MDALFISFKYGLNKSRFFYFLLFSLLILFISQAAIASNFANPNLILEHIFTNSDENTLNNTDVQNTYVTELNDAKWQASPNSYNKDGTNYSTATCQPFQKCTWSHQNSSAVIDIQSLLESYQDNPYGIFEVEFKISRPRDRRSEFLPDPHQCNNEGDLFLDNCPSPRDSAWVSLGFYKAGTLDVEKGVQDSSNQAVGTISWHQDYKVRVFHENENLDSDSHVYEATLNSVEEEVFVIRIDGSNFSTTGYELSFFRGFDRQPIGSSFSVNESIQYIALSRNDYAWAPIHRVTMTAVDKVAPTILLDEAKTTLPTGDTFQFDQNITAFDTLFNGSFYNYYSDIEYFILNNDEYEEFDINSFSTQFERQYNLKLRVKDVANNYSSDQFWTIDVLDYATADSAIEKIYNEKNGLIISLFDLNEISRIYGAEPVSEEYLAVYRNAISNTPIILTMIDKRVAVLTLMDSVVNIIDVMKAADSNDASMISIHHLDKSILPELLVDANNLEIYRQFIAALTSSDLDSRVKIQAMINAANNFSSIQKYADYSTNKILTFEQFKTLELLTLSYLYESNLNYYLTEISFSTASAIQTVADLQNLINQANNKAASANAVSKILDANQMGDGSSITFDDLSDVIGAVPVDVQYLSVYQNAIGNTPLAGNDALTDVLTLLDSVVNIIDIMKAADSNDASLINVTHLVNAIVPELTVEASNLDIYRQFISQLTANDINSRFAILSLVEAANNFRTIQNYADDPDNSDLLFNQLESLNLMGLGQISSLYHSYYLAEIGAVLSSDIQTVSQLQLLIDQGNTIANADVGSLNAVTTIVAANQIGNASAVSVSDLMAVLDAPFIEDKYLSLYQQAIAVTSLDSIPSSNDHLKVLALINSVWAITEFMEAADADDASQITNQMFLNIFGLNDYQEQFITEYRLAIERLTATELNSSESINLMMSTVNGEARLDSDLDGRNNYIDNDDDGDRLADDLDPNDQLRDSDLDGIEDGADADVNGDGELDNGAQDVNNNGIRDIADAALLAGQNSRFDTDGDGILDDYDSDADNDYMIFDRDIDDLVRDVDGDTIIDGFDADMNDDGIEDNGIDSDNDGIVDLADVDSYCGGVDADSDGILDAMTDDQDRDGLADQTDPDNTNPDIDHDGILDGIDVDYDGDNAADHGVDTDNDGMIDCADADLNNDGVVDQGSDFDGDGIRDSYDFDDDGDLIPDALDMNPFDGDHDQDGILNNVDVDINGDGTLDNGSDSDQDGIRDFNGDGKTIDSDLDNNGEVDKGVVDYAGDGVVDSAIDNIDSLVEMTDDSIMISYLRRSPDLDMDNDGILNNAEVDRDRDGQLDDLDNDGIPDILDKDVAGTMADGSGDSDRDGASDYTECPLFPTCDADENGILDHLDARYAATSQGDSEDSTIPNEPTTPSDSTPPSDSTTPSDPATTPSTANASKSSGGGSLSLLFLLTLSLILVLRSGQVRMT